jgi:alpha-1,3-mannosyltransferase
MLVENKVSAFFPGDPVRPRMRIVHVVRQYDPGIGGLEAVVRSLAREQVKSGHHVRVVTLNRIFRGDGARLPAHETRDRIEICRIGYAGSMRYPLAPAVLRHLSDADIVHVHAIDFFFDFLAMTRLLHRKPLVVSTHGGFFHTAFASRLKTIYFKTVTRASLTRYAYVAASSVQDREKFAEIRGRGLDVLENGVDIAKFRDCGANDGEKAIIYFGRLAPHKQIDKLFPFLRSLRARDPQWRLVVAGLPSGVEIADLEATARDAGVAADVRFLDSPDDENLREAISHCSVFASPSAYEGFGIAPIEAASAGLLPVLSNIPPHARTVERLGLGALVDFSRPDEAAETMLAHWRALEADRGAWRARALDAVLQFGWTGVARDFEDIYRRVKGEDARFILGAETRVANSTKLVQTIDDRIADGSHCRLAFLNANLANVISGSRSLQEKLRSFTLVNDGIGMDIASLLLYGRRFPENLNGTDFTPHFLETSRHRLRVFLLGSREDVVRRAAARLCERWPRHIVVGCESGYFPAHEEAALVERIRAASPDLVLVGMGNPRQEEWIADHLSDVPCSAFAVGALFDFMTDEVPRASGWLRAIRCEWMFRLALEPRRLWRRYLLGNPLFLARVVAQRLRGERAA